MRVSGTIYAACSLALIASGTFNPQLGFGAEEGTDSAAPVAAAHPQQQTEADPPEGSAPSKLSEVLVTAEKRSERLQDVPIPVSAITADGLLENNQTRIEDYFAKIPGSISRRMSAARRSSPFAVSSRGLTSSIRQ